MSPAPKPLATACAAEGQWRCQPLAGGLGPHRNAWEQLNEREFGSHPMLCAAFVDRLLAHFGQGDEWLCWLEREGAIQAMCIVRRLAWWHWASFLPAQAQIGPTLLKHERDLTGLVQCLPGGAQALDLLCVDPMLSELSVATPRSIRWHQAVTMTVECRAGFETYMAALPTGLRQNLRRYNRRAQTEFTSIAHRVVTDRQGIAEAVRRYASLESAGWKGAQGTALAPGNAQERFYGELLMQWPAEGHAEVHELWLGERLAASRLVAVLGGVAVMLKTTFDEALSKHAPGRLLLMHCLEHQLETQPALRVEFYTNASRDQLAWATSSRPIRHLRLFRNGPAQLALMGVRALRNALGRTSEPAPSGEPRITVHVHPDELPPKALALMREAEARHGIELGPDWYRLMVEQVFSPPAQCRFFVLWRAGEAQAVLPLVVDQPHAREVRSLGNFYTALCTPIVAPGTGVRDLVPLVHQVFRHWPKAGRLNLGPIDPESIEFGLVRAALEDAGLVPFRYFRFGHWSLPCRGLGYAPYLATRDGATRSTVARMARRFAAKGGRVEIITSGDQLQQGLDAFERVYARSWKQAEPFPDFIRGLMRTCAAHGWLRLGLAWLGDEPVAAQCWIVAAGRAEIFKLAYDQQHEKLSAGTLLTAALMEQVLDRDQVEEVDYLIGDDPYKRVWMTRRDERWGLLAHHPWRWHGLMGALHSLLGAILRPWRKRRPKSAPGRTT